MKIPVYNIKGDKVSDLDGPDAIWGLDRHTQPEFLSIRQRLGGLRSGTASTKTRAEVRGGGRKPFRQKGTGRARQGSSTSPINPGGGVTFGPRPRSFSFDLNRKVRRIAMFSALSSRVSDGSVRVVEGVKLDEPKTKAALDLLNANLEPKTLIIYDPEGNGELGLCLNNTPIALAIPYNFLNVYDILNAKRIVVTSEAVKEIGEVWL